MIETFCDPGTDAQAFLCVCHKRNMAVLAFRGTEPDLKDIKTDIKARLLPAEYNGNTELMHEGYFSQFASISRDIEQALEQDEVKNKQLFITGHSLGGALAITAVAGCTRHARPGRTTAHRTPEFVPEQARFFTCPFVNLSCQPPDVCQSTTDSLFAAVW